MGKDRTSIPEAVRVDVLAACNNRCCVCQTPFVQIHHIDEDPSNNEIENLAPLCPNCHTQAHHKGNIVTNLTPGRIVELRDRWYAYCEKRKDSTGVGANAMLKLKNFVRSMGSAQYGWARTFADIDPAYAEMNRDEIINRVFSTSNRDDLVAYLETVKQMYQVETGDAADLKRFEGVCNAFGIGLEELDWLPRTRIAT